MRRRKCGIGGLPIQLIGVRTRVDDWRSSRAKPPFSHCQFDQAWNFSRLRSSKLAKLAQAHKQRADKSWVGTYYSVWWEWWEKLDALCDNGEEIRVSSPSFKTGYVKLGTLSCQKKKKKVGNFGAEWNVKVVKWWLGLGSATVPQRKRAYQTFCHHVKVTKCQSVTRLYGTHFFTIQL